MSHLMNEAQAVKFFENLAQVDRYNHGTKTESDTEDTYKKASDDLKDTVIMWQINMLKLIEADENQANPSRLPPPGIDINAPGYDPGDDWPTDANRLIDDGDEARALASLLYSHAARSPHVKRFVTVIWIMLSGAAQVFDKDGKEIPGAEEPRRRAGASKTEKAAEFGRIWTLALRHEFVELARRDRR